MFETMYAAPGIGLAATQVDWHHQLVVIDISEEKNAPQVFINPEILEKSGKATGEEGCLSVPGIFDDVPRAERIRVRWHDADGKVLERELDGMLRRVQHEMIISRAALRDYLSEMKRRASAISSTMNAEAHRCGASGGARQNAHTFADPPPPHHALTWYAGTPAFALPASSLAAQHRAWACSRLRTGRRGAGACSVRRREAAAQRWGCRCCSRHDCRRRRPESTLAPLGDGQPDGGGPYVLICRATYGRALWAASHPCRCFRACAVLDPSSVPSRRACQTGVAIIRWSRTRYRAVTARAPADRSRTRSAELHELATLGAAELLRYACSGADCPGASQGTRCHTCGKLAKSEAAHRLAADLRHRPRIRAFNPGACAETRCMANLKR